MKLHDTFFVDLRVKMTITKCRKQSLYFQLIFASLFATLVGLWGLVNNAGILYMLPIEWAPLDNFKRTADVNLWGMIDVTKTFLPLVKKARGRVVNFSSVAGR